jgi:thioredoxin 1
MNAIWKILIVVALVAAIVAVFAMKRNAGGDTITVVNVESANAAVRPPSEASDGMSQVEEDEPLPRLVDVGAGTCIPCKMMMPVLEELRQEYAGSLRVEYHDVNKDPNAVAEYKIMTIPTQIFYDASGNELFRHTGFIAKEDILAKWEELGVELTRAQ